VVTRQPSALATQRLIHAGVRAKFKTDIQNALIMKEANRKDAARKKSLGELGELFAIKALVDKSFDKIRNLNDKRLNEPFADLECERNGKKYIISVKARNKYQKGGTLNTRYNLGLNAYDKAISSEKKHNAIAHWMAIQFDRKSYSIYFGSLEDLNGSKAIPVDKCEKGQTGEVWVHNKRHYFDFDFYTNQMK
jgi:hypothetical protein